MHGESHQVNLNEEKESIYRHLFVNVRPLCLETFFDRKMHLLQTVMILVESYFLEQFIPTVQGWKKFWPSGCGNS